VSHNGSGSSGGSGSSISVRVRETIAHLRARGLPAEPIALALARVSPGACVRDALGQIAVPLDAGSYLFLRVTVDGRQAAADLARLRTSQAVRQLLRIGGALEVAWWEAAAGRRRLVRRALTLADLDPAGAALDATAAAVMGDMLARQQQRWRQGQ
jgi:hypothetical protein